MLYKKRVEKHRVQSLNTNRKQREEVSSFCVFLYWICFYIRYQKLLNALTTPRSLESLDLSAQVCLGNSKPDREKLYLQFKPVSMCILIPTSAHMHG